MAAQLDHLLTLTYRDNQTRPKTAWQHFARFLRLLRCHPIARSFPYVGVLERQKRGAIHIHVAVNAFQDVRLLRNIWRKAIGGDGNIDVQFFRQRLATLAKYLSKYITKDIALGHLEGDHRYKRSRGIHIPKLVVFLPFTAALDETLIGLFEQKGARIKFHLDHLAIEGPKWIWACSW